jgi:hypothetical protein
VLACIPPASGNERYVPCLAVHAAVVQAQATDLPNVVNILYIVRHRGMREPATQHPHGSFVSYVLNCYYTEEHFYPIHTT